MIFTIEKRPNDNDNLVHHIQASLDLKTPSLARCPSAVLGEFIMISAEGENASKISRNYAKQIISETEVPTLKNGQVVKIYAKMCIDERILVNGKHTTAFVSTHDVLPKFIKRTGLTPANQLNYQDYPRPEVTNDPMLVSSKIKIINGFTVSGVFVVMDETLTNDALKNGIGDRRSYGYGLVLAEIIDQLSTSETSYVESKSEHS